MLVRNLVICFPKDFYCKYLLNFLLEIFSVLEKFTIELLSISLLSVE
jgi:hypothetical protein